MVVLHLIIKGEGFALVSLNQPHRNLKYPLPVHQPTYRRHAFGTSRRPRMVLRSQTQSYRRVDILAAATLHVPLVNLRHQLAEVSQ